MSDTRADSLLVLAGIAAAGAALLAADAFLVEPGWVEVTSQELPVPDLPASWEGARVVHLTDLHYGNPRSERLFRWMVKTVNDLKPDLVVVTGDFVVDQEREVAPCAGYMAQLRSRRGTVGILGDHDFRGKVKQPIPGVEEAVRGAGVRLLRNEVLELADGLLIAGLDPNTRKVNRADLNAALRGLHGRKPHLLLAHSPDIIGEAAAAGLGVVLCGHTHGGQVVVPFYGPPVTHTKVPRKYASGWSGKGDTRMYTCRGLSSHHSLRFLCRPEIAVFTLRRRGNETRN